ncbi:HAMP domain-containing protein [Paracoccus sp. Z118]|uniref:HAMP domain-containing protein n=1 Tax=Paracoccus sp. Z118 TaxID=2851017 RepID=UPI001C2CB728|nr:HAMP domain-containing protein [Paracoccus sp. Z118]MBV0890826.1 HAMP domain-containing protein [Paracoccus sp. Z118]
MPRQTLIPDSLSAIDKQLLVAMRALRRGNFSVRMPTDMEGDDAFMAHAFNDVVDMAEALTEELTRIHHDVIVDGRTRERAHIDGAEGNWRGAVTCVNRLVEGVAAQNETMLNVIRAVSRGDLSQSVPTEIGGRPLAGDLRASVDAVNGMVEHLATVSSEVTRLAREVGTAGQLGGQAKVEGAQGTWKDLTDNVNSMASNLTGQLRNIADVTTAVARGDLSRKITVDVHGELLDLKATVNTMVDQLNAFASEVTRVAREVGTEGKLGGQARVDGVAGTWRDLTDSVNGMAGNLTIQLRDVSKVATAIASGDLTQQITVEAEGEILQIKQVINTMVDQLSSFASEVTRVAREVGTDGILGGQAEVEGVAGTWRKLTQNVNGLATNLTSQVREIAEVTTAVARGDLSKKITVDAKGEILELKNTMNTMVDQLSAFASEVTRVAREVGTEGKLGGQARVEGVAGTWKDLTDNVNQMAENLTGQVRNIAEVTTAVARGDLSKKITVTVQGEMQEMKDTINTMVDQLNRFASEVTRVAREVGTDGKLGGEARVEGVEGTWRDLTENVNGLATNLTGQVRNIAEVTTAVARGDLSKKITVDARGEILELKNTINTMVDQLNGFASEVTRVAREVGTQGRLGGQAQVAGVGGTWADLTDNVNLMADNLTNQVRGIARVVTAVANGDLKRKLTLDVKGEMAELAETINGMIDTLATFGDQVTDVAREVGVEGKLGGQARVPGASGLWRDLTDNVNQLAANLTTQVRAIAEVATAVAEGDLTRTITVEANGEVAALKDNVNRMIGNLRTTTEYNEQQDWLKTNLTRFTRLMQGQRNLEAVCNLLLSGIAPLIEAQHGAIWLSRDDAAEGEVYELAATYAMTERRHLSARIRPREGLVGQCAVEKQRILLTNVPGDYVRIRSGLGEGSPLNIVVVPVLFEGQVMALIELASFSRFTSVHLDFLDQLVESIGIVLNTISASMKTETLLSQSQMLAGELQTQQHELQSTNARLEEQATRMRESEEMLRHQQEALRGKNEELEDKATQLALTSKYKSEFLANMSHELRTPLNSLLILSKLLADNNRGNLNDRQVQQAQTIHDSGADLLRMINDILDLSKIESGTVVLDVDAMRFDDFAHQMDRQFREVGEQKGLDFRIEIDPALPATMATDAMRLQQILKNLLSNAFKFTEKGGVTLSVTQAAADAGFRNARLSGAGRVVAFAVSDTGIGVQPAQQQVIFEAFQQADGTTSRRYGGTGLGLSISRELALLLGGEINLVSTPGQGSTFTLYLPLESGLEEDAGTRPAGMTQVAPRQLAAPETERQEGGEAKAGRDEGADPAPAQPPVSENANRPAEPPLTASPPPRPAPADEEGPVATATMPTPRDPSRPLVAIVEDDPVFARILLDIADERGFDGVIVSRGRELPSVIRQQSPDAISLDIQLPDVDGWALVDRITTDRELRHVPVHLISVVDDEQQLRGRGIEYSGKPVSRERLIEVFDKLREQAARSSWTVTLVAEPGDPAATALRAMLERLAGIALTVVPPSGMAEALDRPANLLVVLAHSFDAPLAELLKTLTRAGDAPLALLSLAQAPGPAEHDLVLRSGADLVVADEPDPALLMDRVAAGLRLRWDSLPADIRSAIGAARPRDEVLEGERVLVIDDDIRNIFSMTALLEDYGLQVLSAESGPEGLKLLEQNPDIAAALVDIMMPEMDGYEVIRRIRRSDQLRDLPVIAVTAKAMQEDRDRCFEAGASDYLSKPVDREDLISVLRTWTKRRRGTNGGSA